MISLEYQAPDSVSDALDWLSSGECRILAGGTDLLVGMRSAPPAAGTLIDIKRIPDIDAIVADDDTGLKLGAAAKCYDVSTHSGIRLRYPALADAAGVIGGIAIRNRATVGGNICNAAPSADTIPALIVVGAECKVEGPGGNRTVPAAGFCNGPGRTVLCDGELLVNLTAPTPPKSSGSAYLRFIPRGEMDIAVAGAGAYLALEEDGRTIAAARIALSAVGPTPLLVEEAEGVLVGAEASDEVFSLAADLARDAARPIDDLRGSAKYRRHLCAVLTRRALSWALSRAKGEAIDE